MVENITGWFGKEQDGLGRNRMVWERTGRVLYEKCKVKCKVVNPLVARVNRKVYDFTLQV